MTASTAALGTYLSRKLNSTIMLDNEKHYTILSPTPPPSPTEEVFDFFSSLSDHT